MPKRKLTKHEDDIRRGLRSPDAPAPYDDIHTCSKGCKKPGCTRTLRDTIEEQDKQIEALKRDVLEKTAELRKKAMETIHDINHIGGLQEENARLKAEVEKLTFDPMSYLDDQGEWMPRHTHLAASARLKAEAVAKDYLVTQLKAEVERLTAIVGADAIDREHGMCCDASAQVERLTKAGDAMADWLDNQGNYGGITDGWHKAKEVHS